MAEMDRSEAATLLGVSVDATGTEIKAAFRRRVWSSHPDTSGETSFDLDALTAARNVLLSASHVRAKPMRPPVGPRPNRAPVQTRSGKSFEIVWKLIGIAVALLVVGVVTIVVIAVATGNDPDVGPPVVEEECLVVTDTDVVPSPCTADGAQRIVDTLTGARLCPAGTNTLVAGSTTWCLAPSQ